MKELKEKTHELSADEEERLELSLLVYDAASIFQRPRMGIEWSILSNGKEQSCAHITLGRKGNILSVYTSAGRKARKRKSLPLDAVEVYIFDEKYERLAYAIANRLAESGYEAGVRFAFDDRILDNKI